MASHPRSVLITGTSSGGIGCALVSAFASQNFTVSATARDASKIPTSISSLPNVQVLTLDVTSSALINAAVEAVKVKTGGTLDYLVNNAGAGYTTPMVDVDIEAGKKAFMPLLLEAKGTVVNISSVGTLVHTPWIGYYCFCKAVKPTGPSIGACIYAASKAALSLASETLRLELTPFGVHVVTVMVGSVGNTNFHANSPEYRLPPSSIYQPIERFIADTDSGKLQPPDTELDAFAADLVRDILKGRKGQVWLGNLARMTKWVSTWVPWGMFDGMVAKGRGIDVLMKTAQGGKA